MLLSIVSFVALFKEFYFSENCHVLYNVNLTVGPLWAMLIVEDVKDGKISIRPTSYEL